MSDIQDILGSGNFTVDRGGQPASGPQPNPQQFNPNLAQPVPTQHSTYMDRVPANSINTPDGQMSVNGSTPGMQAGINTAPLNGNQVNVAGGMAFNQRVAGQSAGIPNVGGSVRVEPHPRPRTLTQDREYNPTVDNGDASQTQSQAKPTGNAPVREQLKQGGNNVGPKKPANNSKGFALSPKIIIFSLVAIIVIVLMIVLFGGGFSTDKDSEEESEIVYNEDGSYTDEEGNLHDALGYIYDPDGNIIYDPFYVPFEYTEEEIADLRAAGYTGDEIEQFQTDEIDAQTKIDEAAKAQQDFITQQRNEVNAQEGDLYTDILNNTWLGMPENWKFTDVTEEWTTISENRNVDYEKFAQHGNQLFLKVYLDDRVHEQWAFMQIDPIRYAQLEDRGNIIVTITFRCLSTYNEETDELEYDKNNIFITNIEESDTVYNGE